MGYSVITDLPMGYSVIAGLPMGYSVITDLPMGYSVVVYSSIGMGLLQISKIDTYPPKLGTGGSTAANYSSPSTPPKRLLLYIM